MKKVSQRRLQKANFISRGMSPSLSLVENPGRRDFLKGLGLSVAALSLPSLFSGCEFDTEGGGRPNIILILADDVGISNIGCYGGSFPTPNIDSLADNGVRFEYCYATPLCGPSRCQILTGRYPFRTGVNDNNCANRISPASEVMIPTVLKSAGYVTASVGKWGQLPLGPPEWGFDEYLSYRGHGRYWGNENGWGRGYTQNGEELSLPDGGYFPDIMHDFAVDFIKRNRSNPFFLYYPMDQMHSNLTKTPDTIAGITTGSAYGDNMAYMDKLVGKLVDEVNNLGLLNNTLIIFTGDNGQLGVGSINGRRVFGEKRGMNEGGCRVPFVASWAGVTRGKVNSGLTDFSDFLPTFAELAGAGLPGGVTIDGVSVAQQLRGRSGGGRSWVYVECTGRSFVRDSGFKLTNRGEMFDMSDAPWSEIPTENPEARLRLQKVLDDHPALPGSGGGGSKD